MQEIPLREHNVNNTNPELTPEVCPNELRVLSNTELDIVAGGTGDEIDSSGPELTARRSIRIDRVYRK